MVSLPQIPVIDHTLCLNLLMKFYPASDPALPEKLLSIGFVILVMGLMLRSDHLGVTSVIRDLALRHDCYETMLHFFRSSSWTLDSLAACWYRAVSRFEPFYKENGRAVLVVTRISRKQRDISSPLKALSKLPYVKTKREGYPRLSRTNHT